MLWVETSWYLYLWNVKSAEFSFSIMVYNISFSYQTIGSWDDNNIPCVIPQFDFMRIISQYNFLNDKLTMLLVICVNCFMLWFFVHVFLLKLFCRSMIFIWNFWRYRSSLWRYPMTCKYPLNYDNYLYSDREKFLCFPINAGSLVFLMW